MSESPASRYRAIIVDDEAPARRLIRQYLAKYPEFELIAECENGIEAVKTIRNLQPNLVFLDIQMPGLNGLEVLTKLSEMPAIIFTTAYEQYAVQAFEVNAIDYLLKPYDAEVVDRAVQRFLARGNQRGIAASEINRLIETARAAGSALSHPLLVDEGGKLLPVPVNTIIRIQAARDYSELVCTDGRRHICNQGISALERRLDPGKFLRVHRSAMIALAAIKHIKKDYTGRYRVRLRNGDEVRVSRSYAGKVRALIV